MDIVQFLVENPSQGSGKLADLEILPGQVEPLVVDRPARRPVGERGPTTQVAKSKSNKSKSKHYRPRDRTLDYTGATSTSNGAAVVGVGVTASGSTPSVGVPETIRVDTPTLGGADSSVPHVEQDTVMLNSPIGTIFSESKKLGFVDSFEPTTVAQLAGNDDTITPHTRGREKVKDPHLLLCHFTRLLPEREIDQRLLHRLDESFPFNKTGDHQPIENSSDDGN